MDNIIVIGSSGHARVVIDIIEEEGRYNIVGLCDRFREIGENTEGYLILGKEEDLPFLIEKHKVHGIIVAIGDNFVRGKVSNKIKNICPEIKFISAVHPKTAIAKNVEIGEGTVIVAGVVANSKAKIGKGCIINTSASIGHDVTIEDYASVGPGTRIAGGCTIGTGTAVGIGSVVREKINIGAGTIIGASSTIIRDIKDRQVAYGSPAKIIRDRQEGEPYLK
ncbi:MULTISPECIES: acetyltransferase [Morganellaceae]|uniref:acetyltransferase n=1 Tax=Morganellaceae TaxID=1903414 RepID=UPI00236106E9|nr:acetyltransferase [Proteus mirabilis]MDC9779229.1 acetyltransferase [Proteus mirabilis]